MPLHVPGGALRKIAEQTGTGASGVLEFPSIPATYRGLMLLFALRSDVASTSATLNLVFETSPTAGAYNYELFNASAATVSGAENVGATDRIIVGAVPGASSTANVYATGEILIPEYANTGMFKSTMSRMSANLDISTTLLQVYHTSGLWESTAAIDRIRLTLAASNFTTASRATLYGIAG